MDQEERAVPKDGPTTMSKSTEATDRIRRRYSKALDKLLGIEPLAGERFEGDYWHDTHMDRDWSQREAIGRAMAEARWVP